MYARSPLIYELFAETVGALDLAFRVLSVANILRFGYYSQVRIVQLDRDTEVQLNRDMEVQLDR